MQCAQMFRLSMTSKIVNETGKNGKQAQQQQQQHLVY